MHRRHVLTGTASALVSALASPALPGGQTEVSLLFPVAVGGPIATIIDGLAAEFTRDHPAIRVTPTYVGSYQDAIAAFLAANRSGTPPTLSVLLSTDLFTMIDEGAIVPFDPFIETAED